MGLQNLESLGTNCSSSKPSCSSPTTTSLTSPSSSPSSALLRKHRQTLLTDKLFVVKKERRHGIQLSVDREKPRTPDMSNFKHQSKLKEDKRLKPYHRPSLSCKSNQNLSRKVVERVKSVSNYLSLNLARLPLRDLSSEAVDSDWPVPVPANSASSPLLPQPKGNVTPKRASSSEKSLGPCSSPLQAVNHSSSSQRRLHDIVKKRSLFVSPSNGSPVAPPFSPISDSIYLSESQVTCSSSFSPDHKSPNQSKPSKSLMASLRPDLIMSSSPSSIDKPRYDSATKKDKVVSVARSPSRLSSLQLKKSFRDPQFTQKLKESDVYIVSSSSEAGDDSSASSSMSNHGKLKPKGAASSSSAKRGKKRMRINKKSEVIVIDDPPMPSKCHRSSSSSDDFEDIRSSHKKPRCEEIIDLTCLDDTPPRVGRTRVTSSTPIDPNRTPEFVLSSRNIWKSSDSSLSPLSKPIKKALNFMSDSDSEMTPLLSKSFGLLLSEAVGDNSSDDDKESGIDEIISIVDKLAEGKISVQDEKLYEALSENSFHSCPSMSKGVEESTAPNSRVNCNLDLVHGFTLDLNSEEEEDDVFNDCEEPTLIASSGSPSSSEPISSTSVSPVEYLKMNCARVLSAGSEDDIESEEPCSGNIATTGVETAAKQPVSNSNVDVDPPTSSSGDGGGVLAAARQGSSVVDMGVPAEHPVSGVTGNDDVIAQPGGQLSENENEAKPLGGVAFDSRDLQGTAGESSKCMTSVNSVVRSVVSNFVSHNLTVPESHAGMTEDCPLLTCTKAEGSWGGIQQEMRSLLARRGVSTRPLGGQKTVRHITSTQENYVNSKLEDDTRLPSQRLCFVAQYLRLFTTRLRIPSAEVLSQLWQLIWKPLVSGSGQLTDETVNVCMQYLKQLVVLHPPGQHQLVDQQYAKFLEQIVGQAKDNSHGLWDHLETLAKSPATTMMVTFLVDLLLADLWAFVTSKKSSTPLFVRLFWKGQARNLTLPIRRLMDEINIAAAERERSPNRNDQITNLMALIYMAGTVCTDLSTELTLRWSKLKGHTQSFLVGHVHSTSLRLILVESLPEVRRIHAAYRLVFSGKLGTFSGKVKPVQLFGADREEVKSSAPEEGLKSDSPSPAPVFVCTKSKPSVRSVRNLCIALSSPSLMSL